VREEFEELTMTTGIQTPLPHLPVAAARMTADEFARLYAGRRAELIDGVPVELPMPQQQHGKICYRIAMAIGAIVDANDLGHATTNDSFVRVGTKDDPERVRGADVCYFSYDGLPKGEIPPGLLPVVPNLVVEVRSPTEVWSEVFTKVGEYLGAGVTAVLVLDPDTRSASVYRNDNRNPQQIMNRGDELTLPDILPGFAVPVTRLFE
jgi:Uma2 family endonuclease